MRVAICIVICVFLAQIPSCSSAIASESCSCSMTTSRQQTSQNGGQVLAQQSQAVESVTPSSRNSVTLLAWLDLVLALASCTGFAYTYYMRSKENRQWSEEIKILRKNQEKLQAEVQSLKEMRMDSDFISRVEKQVASLQERCDALGDIKPKENISGKVEHHEVFYLGRKHGDILWVMRGVQNAVFRVATEDGHTGSAVCCIDISELRRDIHTALCDVCEVKGVPIEEASGYVMEQEATVQRVSTEKWQVIKPAIIRLQ